MLGIIFTAALIYVAVRMLIWGIKAALGIEKMPVNAREGLKYTLNNFENK